MHTSDSVRKVSKNIVLSYAHHIKKKIEDKDERYLNLGIDDNFEDYERLFKQVAGVALGIPTNAPQTFDKTIIKDSLVVIEDTIKMKGYSRFLKSPILAESVYQVCVFILDKVKEEEFDYIR